MIREALSQTSMPAVFSPRPAAPVLELHVRTAEPDERCYHGGASFEAIGDGFETLYRRERVISADVLDAWFRPSPAVLTTLRAHLDWIVRTSAPTNADGLVRAIARARGVPATSVVVGGGSSDLIFLAFTQWLRPESRVLVLDPMYGEYAHVLEQVVGCHVDRLTLRREEQYRVSMAELELAMRRGYDLVVLVNPNSPTGQHVPARELAEIVARAPAATRVWIDESYVEYAGADESLESLAAESDRLVICKSMSKVYALSGVRVAYLVTGAEPARALRRRTPPWAVGLAGQIAAVKALESRTHYRRYWTLTHRLRAGLARELEAITGVEVVPGVANFLLVHLASCLPNAATVVTRCRAEGLFLRDAGVMCPSLGDRAIRITVRDRMSNQRLIEIFRRALGVC
jgi:histidinol-phosphate/aromatic aminotransferase/cobyric acid decarboxylase-like protein